MLISGASSVCRVVCHYIFGVFDVVMVVVDFLPAGCWCWAFSVFIASLSENTESDDYFDEGGGTVFLVDANYLL